MKSRLLTNQSENTNKTQTCIHYCCRSCSEHAPQHRRKKAEGCKVSLDAAQDWTCGCLYGAPVGPQPCWLNQAGKGEPRLGYFWDAVSWH